MLFVDTLKVLSLLAFSSRALHTVLSSVSMSSTDRNSFTFYIIMLNPGALLPGAKGYMVLDRTWRAVTKYLHLLTMGSSQRQTSCILFSITFLLFCSCYNNFWHWRSTPTHIRLDKKCWFFSIVPRCLFKWRTFNILCLSILFVIKFTWTPYSESVLWWRQYC